MRGGVGGHEEGISAAKVAKELLASSLALEHGRRRRLQATVAGAAATLPAVATVAVVGLLLLLLLVVVYSGFGRLGVGRRHGGECGELISSDQPSGSGGAGS